MPASAGGLVGCPATRRGRVGHPVGVRGEAGRVHPPVRVGDQVADVGGVLINRGEGVAGPDITESEHEVTLHAERAVVDTEAVPVERVRLGKETVTEQEHVTGAVRKERIEADLPDEQGRRTLD